jgi:tRNA 2-thiouridine synthesizing protein A
MANANAPIDARGLSCPQPVMLTRQAIRDSAGGQVVVLLDSMTQVENCTRAAKQLGWTATANQKGDVFELTIRK